VGPLLTRPMPCERGGEGWIEEEKGEGSRGAKKRGRKERIERGAEREEGWRGEEGDERGEQRGRKERGGGYIKTYVRVEQSRAVDQI
jgi:hypothetical protein